MSRTPRARFMSMAGFTLLVIALLIAGLLAAIAAGVDLSQATRDVVDSFYPPAAVTEQGAEIRALYDIVFFIGVVIFFVVEGLIIWTVLRYRRRPGDDELPPQTHGNMLAEVVWTVVPTVIVAFLFVVSWQTLNTVEATAANPDTKVRAVAGQFQWTFEYLDEEEEVLFTQLLPIGDDGGMVVPAGRTVQVHLVSPDVIHAFYVPQFLFKRDAVPGRLNIFDFKVNAEDAGQTFRGQCAELCGAGHRVMLFDVHAYTPADYDAWFAAKVEAASATPTPAPTGEPGGVVVRIEAKDIQFIQREVTVPADTPFRIEFVNDDAGIPHNVEIFDSAQNVVFFGEIFNGIETRMYDVPALAAGSYPFICTVHPNMTGTITVE